MASEPRDVIPNGGPVDEIPLCLRERAQWVGWTAPGKVPVDPKTGRPASTTDPSTWGTFEEAFTGTVLQWDGVGYVFSADDPYCGIDLDDVIDTTTGEIDADAVATIERFGSYAELSPSGTGVHIICEATPPGGAGRKRGDRECYWQGRFFTFTGRRVSEARAVEPRQHVLNVWHAETFPVKAERERAIAPAASPLSLTDEEIVRKIEGSKQGDKFRRLWSGDTTGYSSGSEADLALCGILAFWCQRDLNSVDRLFRASGLMRAKWDAQRGEMTYGQRTVAKAVSESASYDPDYRSESGSSASPVVWPKANADGRRFKWASELTAPPKADDWIWEGYLPQAGIALLSALWKAGKTTLLSHLLRACGEGGAFLGKPIKACKVLYVSEEGERHWVRRRDSLGLTDNAGFYLQPFPAKPGQGDWIAFVAQLVKDIETHGFDLIVFDTLAKLWPVQEENDAGGVDAALMPLWSITKAGASVLLIHHLRKSGGQEYTGSRGSGALSAFPDIIIELTRHDAGDHRSKKRVLRAKGRYEETPDELTIELIDGVYQAVTKPEPQEGTPTVGPIATTAAISDEDRVLEVVRLGGANGMTSDDVRAALKGCGSGVRAKHVSDHLASLYARGIVTFTGQIRNPANPRRWLVAGHSQAAEVSPPLGCESE